MPAPPLRPTALIQKSYFKSKPYFHRGWSQGYSTCDVWINTLRYLCHVLSPYCSISVNLWVVFLAVASLLLLFVPAAVQSEGQSTLSAPSTHYWFFCTTRFNERPIAQGLSFTHTWPHTHTHTCCSKSGCHNSWYLSRRAVTLTDARGCECTSPRTDVH